MLKVNPESPGMAHRIDNDLWLWFTVRIHRLLDQAWFGLNRAKLSARYNEVEKMLLFVGYPRSGHSFVGSLLDAHPEVLIAHRLDVVRSLTANADMARLYYLMQRNSERFNANNRRLTGYSSPMKTGWQGAYDRLSVVGDQEGKRTSLKVGRSPELLAELAVRKNPPMYFLHITRNSFDNIATWAARTGRSLDATAQDYFELCECNQKIIDAVRTDRLLTIRHEDVIGDFDVTVSRILNFLGLPAPKGYLDACRATVYPLPNRSRDRVSWTEELIGDVERQMKTFEFLQNYGYKN